MPLRIQQQHTDANSIEQPPVDLRNILLSAAGFDRDEGAPQMRSDPCQKRSAGPALIRIGPAGRGDRKIERPAALPQDRHADGAVTFMPMPEVVEELGPGKLCIGYEILTDCPLPGGRSVQARYPGVQPAVIACVGVDPRLIHIDVELRRTFRPRRIMIEKAGSRPWQQPVQLRQKRIPSRFTKNDPVNRIDKFVVDLLAYAHALLRA